MRDGDWEDLAVNPTRAELEGYWCGTEAGRTQNGLAVSPTRAELECYWCGTETGRTQNDLVVSTSNP